jgi:hypothetical protein
MLCTTTCPAPCPAGSPVPCGPPVSCPAPSPCTALSDPSKSDLTYTEWRSKDWFSKANWISSTPAWNAPLDQNAIPSGGACIAGSAGMHSFCDDSQTTRAGTANNIYIRETGTCVNSKQLCDIKGVSYSSLGPSSLGPGDVEGATYPTCFVSQNQKIVEDLLGSTITRFANSGAALNLTIKPVSTGDPVLDSMLNTVGQGLATAAGVIATGSAQALVGAVTGAVEVTVAGAAPILNGSAAAAFSASNQDQLACAIGGIFTGKSCAAQPSCPTGKYVVNFGSGTGCCTIGTQPRSLSERGYTCCPTCLGGTLSSGNCGANGGYSDCCCTCPAGQSLIQGACATCPSGSELVGQKCCPTCPSGQWRVTKSDGSCVCSQCPPGYSVSNGQCVCPTGNEVINGTCCPVCTGGKKRVAGTSGCGTCSCPAGQYDDNGTCRNQGSCPPGKMYTGTGRPMSASDCRTACSGATPVWNPDTQTCVAATSCPPGKPYVSPPTDRISVPGITNVSFCSTGCEGTINGMTAFADETTRTCVGNCPSGTTIDFLTKKCVGVGACPPDKPWYDINGVACLSDVELGLLGEAKYQSSSSNPGKLGVCPPGKKKNTGTTGGFCVPIASGEKDQMTDVIGNYGWNIQGIGNDTAASAYCSANGGALMYPKTCSNCGAGQYVNPSTGQCTACPADTYKTGNGWKIADCTACTGGTYTNGATGQTSSAGCIGTPCPAGQTRSSPTGPCFTPITSCPAGQQKNATGNYCDPCPKDTAKSDTSLNACTPCGPGTGTASTGAATCSQLYTKYGNTTVNTIYDWATTTAYRSYAGVGQVVAGRLDDCYNNCKADPKCKGFVRSRIFGTVSITDNSGNGMCYKVADNFNAVTAVDANKDYYRKN